MPLKKIIKFLVSSHKKSHPNFSAGSFFTEKN